MGSVMRFQVSPRTPGSLRKMVFVCVSHLWEEGSELSGILKGVGSYTHIPHYTHHTDILDIQTTYLLYKHTPYTHCTLAYTQHTHTQHTYYIITQTHYVHKLHTHTKTQTYCQIPHIQLGQY